MGVIFDKQRIEFLKKELAHVALVVLSLVSITLSTVIVTLYRKTEKLTDENKELHERLLKKVTDDEQFHKSILEQLVRKQTNSTIDTVVFFSTTPNSK